MKFKAAVLNAIRTPLAIEEIDMGELGPTVVLVRIHASGPCHTDLEVIQGQLAYPLPIILGHEGAGVVEAVGSDVSQVKVGEHVVCSWNPHCGHCFYCERDLPILCEPFSRHQPRGLLLDGRSRLSRDGGPMHHFSVVSSHAQYCVVPESGAIGVPKDIAFDRACLIGCGVMTGVGAATREVRVAPGESALVIGCGAVGLNAIQGARIAGAGLIVAADLSATKRETALCFGAHVAVDGGAPDVVEQLKKLTGGRGPDYVFESAGHERAFRLAVEAVRPGGNVVFLGKVNVNQDVSFRWGSLMGEKQIVRSSYGNARPRRDFPWLAQLYLDGKLMLDELITRRIPLDEINSGFDAIRRGDTIREVVVNP
ncbi:MAG: Zn-dependent alcohol dehydrogenase [Burkholderiales bacterium]|nr:Zn-dependent alcohol dehydrogenase [Burkholderiales bacterium]